MNTPARVIDIYLTADRKTLLVLFDTGEYETFAVYPKPRTWLAWLPRIVRRVIA